MDCLSVSLCNSSLLSLTVLDDKQQILNGGGIDHGMNSNSVVKIVMEYILLQHQPIQYTY